MSVTDEQWMAFITRARLDQPLAVPTAVISQVRGRFIAKLVDRLVKFWGEHRATLIPFLQQIAIAALDALVSAQSSIDTVDPPGPA